MPIFRQEVVDVLFNQDLNLLCRIDEMRKEQKIEMEEKAVRACRKKFSSPLQVSQRRANYLRWVLAPDDPMVKASHLTAEEVIK
jgi:hypothetical protein